MAIVSVYKYCSIKGALGIVKSGGIRLNSSANFNDPYDSKFEIKEEDKNKTLNLLTKYFLFKEFLAFFDKNETKLKGNQKTHFKDIKKGISYISDNINYHSKIEIDAEFEKFYKSFPGFYKQIGKLKQKCSKIFNNKTIPDVQNIASKALIGCFSKRNDSILMWSHYADSHRGACIEFEVDDSLFKDIEYNDDKCFFDIYSTVEKLLIENFKGKESDLENKEMINIILKPFYSKAKDWSYEKETRIVIHEKEVSKYPITLTDSYYLNLKIKRIYIGSKVNDNDYDLNDLYAEANSRYGNVGFVYMKLKETEYRIVPDNKEFLYKNIKLKKENYLELIKNEMNKCLKDDCYITLLFLSLSVPSILSYLKTPDIDEKERYLNWFDKIKKENTNKDDNSYMPYFDGEFCYWLKNKLHGDLSFCDSESFNKFKIKKIYFLKNKENYSGQYGGINVIDSSNNYEELYFNITYFGKFMIWEINSFLKKNKDSITISSFPIIDFDEMLNLEKQKFIENQCLENKVFYIDQNKK